MDDITFTIDGRKVKGKQGNTILEVAQQHGIAIPTLCHDPALDPAGACRVCLVEDEKRGTLMAACVTPVAAWMSIRTASQKVLATRKVVVKLLMASHPDSCIVCEKGNRCKLRQVAADLGLGLVEYYPMPNFSGTREVNPFILRDLSKCILCAKCIRADHELVVVGAIDYIDRGFEARPATITDGPLETSECTFCGTCVEACPTGAIFERHKPHRGTATRRVATTCSFCGCGCSFWLGIANKQVVGVQPGIPDSVNQITLCVKGHYGYDFIHHPDRLVKPLVRKEGVLVEASWDQALQTAAQSFKSIKEKHGGQSLALLSGPHCTNEEAFLLKNIAPQALATDHLSNSSQLYMDNLIRGMQETLGFVGTQHTIHELEKAEAVLVIGANPTETAPIVGYSIKKGVRKQQAALIVIDPVEIKLTNYARLWLRLRPGADEILLSGFLNLLLEQTVSQADHVVKRDQSLRALLKSVQDLAIEDLAGKTGVSLATLSAAVKLFCAAEKRAIVFGNGILQQRAGLNLVKMLCTIGSIAELLTKKQTMIFPLTKQSNAMGCFHMGLMNGETPEQTFDKISEGHIKGLWIIGEDPLVSLPGTREIEKALTKLQFLAVSDTFLSGTAAKAHVVFPAATFAEKAGTITNLAGQVQMLRPAIDCVGTSRPDWLIISQVAEQLGTPFGFASAQAISKAIIEHVPLYAKMPLPPTDSSHFCYSLPQPKKKVSFYVPKELPELPGPDKQYPYTLMLGSILLQLGCGHQTRHSARLAKITASEYVAVNPEDASQEEFQDGDVIRLISADGEKKVKALLTEKVPRGVLLLPLPFTQPFTLLSSRNKGQGSKTCQVTIERITS